MNSDDQQSKDRVPRPGALATVYSAYDLQNVLTVMAECLHVLRPHLPATGQAAEALVDLEGCLSSAVHVSRQLLANASPERTDLVFTNVNSVVLDSLSALQRMLGPAICVGTQLTDTAAVVQAHPIELEWLLLNLAANARDAMRDGGDVQIETSIIDIWSPDLLGSVAWAERYVRLTFFDTGHRVPLDVRERMFSPPSAPAMDDAAPSGIGLSRMSFTVRSLGGWIDAEGEEGVGVRVHVHLPIGTAARRN